LSSAAKQPIRANERLRVQRRPLALRAG